jgi:hypothetical protein
MKWEYSDTLKKILRLWDKGELVAGEFRFRLLQTVSPVNVQEFLKLVPKEILEELTTEVENAPTTDQAWTQMRVIGSSSGAWNEEIAARLREEEQQSIRRYRVGVEALRGVLRQKQ